MDKILEPADRVLSNIGRFVLLRPGFSSLVLISAIFITFWENGVIKFSSQSTPQFAVSESPELLVANDIQPFLTSKELTPTDTPTPDKANQAPKSEWKTVKVKSGDTLSTILQRHQVSVKAALEISKLKAAKPLANLQPGNEMGLLVNQDKSLGQLVYAISEKSTLVIKQGGKSFKATQMTKPISIVMLDAKPQRTLTVSESSNDTKLKETSPSPQLDLSLPPATLVAAKSEKSPDPAPTTKLAAKPTEEVPAVQKPADSSTVYVAGEISRSLYTDARKAGLSVKQANQLSQIFAAKGLTKNLKKGDEFSVLYEKPSSEGEKKSGNILYAQVTNKGEVYQAIRFTDPKGKTAYYNQDGKSFLPAISRAPLKYTRVSSHFSKGRRHPLLHITRAHLGVDYSAPSGTPIKAAGDGVIVKRGYQSGYGNMVTIKHDDKYTTLYAHLSRFAKSAKNGTSVKEGEIIGYVGQTGIATGPHLHYEIHVNNVPKNPLTVAISGASIPSKYKKQFLAQAKTLLAQVKLNKAIKLAKNDGKPPASRG